MNLHEASYRGFLWRVEELLTPDNINKRGYSLNTPLYSAVSGGEVDVVKFLLDKGAKVDIPDEDMWTPLHFASSCDGNIEIVRLLLKFGADVFRKTHGGNTPYTLSKNEEIKELLQEHMDAIDIKEPNAL